MTITTTITPEEELRTLALELAIQASEPGDLREGWEPIATKALLKRADAFEGFLRDGSLPE